MNIQNIHYLVGPNATGKTRALDRLCSQHNGFFIPKDRPQKHASHFDEASTQDLLRLTLPIKAMQTE